MTTWPFIPCCWPTALGACACGRNHPETAIGKTPLVQWKGYVTTPPTPAQMAQWERQYPHANRAIILEWLHVLVVDTDSDAALGEATALGLPPTVTATTGKGRHYFYLAPADVVGRRSTRRGHSKSLDLLAGGIGVIPPSRHRNGRIREWVVSPQERTFSEAPKWAVEWLRQAANPQDITPADMPAVIAAADVDELLVSERIQDLIINGTSPRYASRSEAVWAVIMALIEAGYDNATIASVLLTKDYAISEKPRALGRRWLSREIARARAKCDVEVVRA